MSHNSFGHLFRVTTWGESHGPALGCVVDGCPPGLPLCEADVQRWLDLRKPGSSRFVTQRREPDAVRILSGVFEDERTGGPVTTGTPISMVIDNVDQRSRDYGAIARQFRPGHADYTYVAKYGRALTIAAAAGPRRGRRRRGSPPGRWRAKSSASRVSIHAALVQIGPHRIDPDRWGLGGDPAQPVLVPRRQSRRGLGGSPGRGAQGRSPPPARS